MPRHPRRPIPGAKKAIRAAAATHALVLIAEHDLPDEEREPAE